MKSKSALAYVALVLGVVVFFAIILAVQPKANKVVDQAQTVEESKEVVNTVMSTESIQYKVTYVEDSSLEYGKTEVRVKGQPGVRTYTYEVTVKDGDVVSKELVKNEVTKQPVDEVVAEGTKIKWRCVDVTSYDYNWQNDMKCTSSTGETRYTSYSGAAALERQ